MCILREESGWLLTRTLQVFPKGSSRTKLPSESKATWCGSMDGWGIRKLLAGSDPRTKGWLRSKLFWRRVPPASLRAGGCVAVGSGIFESIVAKSWRAVRLLQSNTTCVAS